MSTRSYSANACSALRVSNCAVQLVSLTTRIYAEEAVCAEASRAGLGHNLLLV
jgi:hypothetical protein